MPSAAPTALCDFCGQNFRLPASMARYGCRTCPRCFVQVCPDQSLPRYPEKLAAWQAQKAQEGTQRARVGQNGVRYESEVKSWRVRRSGGTTGGRR